MAERRPGSTAEPMVSGAAPPSLLQSGAAWTTAAVDVVARTAFASAVGAASLPGMLSALRTDDSVFDFYRDLAAAGDAASTFRTPPPVEMRTRRLRPPGWLPARRRWVGSVESVTFVSPYEVRNPAVDPATLDHHQNRIARAQLWRHPDGPRPTIIALHGFSASAGAINSAFFALPWFYSHGCDVALVTLPYHGRRARPVQGIDGIELFSGGMVRLSEGVLQAVSDVRSLVGWLLDSGTPQVGVTGLSLGGYVTSTLAAAEPRLAFAIPNAPVVEMAGIMSAWFPANLSMAATLRLKGNDFDDLRSLLAVHSPLSYPVALTEDRLFIIGGLGDRFAPPSQARALWEHWGRCRLHWYPGNHVVHLQRAEYLREMGHLLGRLSFGEGNVAAA